MSIGRSEDLLVGLCTQRNSYGASPCGIGIDPEEITPLLCSSPVRFLIACSMLCSSQPSNLLSELESSSSG